MADAEQETSAVLDFGRVRAAIDKLTSDPTKLSEFERSMQALRSLVGEPLNGPEFSCLVDHLVAQSQEPPEPLPGVSGLGF